MNSEEWGKLQCGDIIKHKKMTDAIIVHQHYGDSVLAARVVSISNPREWDVVMKVKRYDNADFVQTKEECERCIKEKNELVTLPHSDRDGEWRICAECIKAIFYR